MRASEPARAEAISEALTRPLGRRWAHLRAVGQRAREIAPRYADDAESLVAAAYLHDIGYAPELAVTGFHPLDGAHHARALGFSELVISLVAYHSMAHLEAQLRRLDGELARAFAPPPDHLADAICYCDMTIGPDGRPMDAGDRLAEIQSRYGPDHVVTAFVDSAGQDILAAVRRVEVKLTMQMTHPR